MAAILDAILYEKMFYTSRNSDTAVCFFPFTIKRFFSMFITGKKMLDYILNLAILACLVLF